MNGFNLSKGVRIFFFLMNKIHFKDVFEGANK